MKKMNLVDKFSAVKAMLNGKSVEGFTLEDAIAFLDNRIELTEKKNAGGNAERKPTKEQIANDGLREQIVAFLQSEGKPCSIREIGKGISVESGQKVTALLNPLLTVRKNEPNPNGCVKRTEIKGKAHFEYVTPSVEE
jgi:hypothetical protein